jgi:site-specific DNA-cytosine methylase
MTDERPTHLDLFSGIGGFALAAQWAGFRTVAFVEREKFCQKILAQMIPNRSHRLKGLGNAIVPQVAFEIIKEIRNLIA